MKINQSITDSVVILAITGDLDSFSVAYLKEHLKKLFNNDQHRIIIDLSSVDFIDSAGLGHLVSCLKVCMHNSGDLLLAGPNDSIKDLLRITKLMDIFKVFDTVEDASTSFPE